MKQIFGGSYVQWLIYNKFEGIYFLLTFLFNRHSKINLARATC